MLTEATLPSGMRMWTARPDVRGRRPAVFLLHERYGPVQHSFRLLERMAGEGYVGCMPDLFHRYTGDRAPIERGEARYDPTDTDVLADLDEAMAYLRTLDFVNVANVGMAGFCLSGRTPLVFAGSRRDLRAVAIFHGGVYPRDYDPIYPGQETVANFISKLQCPVMGAFGEMDAAVPLENVRRFRNELEADRKSYHIRVFARAPHAWLDSGRPEYRLQQAEEAWRMMVGFFTDVFAGKWGAGRALWRFESDVATTRMRR